MNVYIIMYLHIHDLVVCLCIMYVFYITLHVYAVEPLLTDTPSPHNGNLFITDNFYLIKLSHQQQQNCDLPIMDKRPCPKMSIILNGYIMSVNEGFGLFIQQVIKPAQFVHAQQLTVYTNHFCLRNYACLTLTLNAGGLIGLSSLT